MDASEKKLSMPMVLGALGLTLIVVLVIAARFIPASGAVAPAQRVAQEDPNAAFYKQKAQECQGDMSKLSPQDQQEVIRRAGSPFYARQVLQSYAASPAK